jgi:hypothetical protein
MMKRAEALQAGLPGDVFAFMAQEFDAQYPLARRCDPKTLWCWRGTGLLYLLRLRDVDGAFPTYRTCLLTASNCLHGFPNRTLAFSADGIFQQPAPRYSRRTLTIDFSDPAWLRLGFLNDGAYNWWNEASDVKRAVQHVVAFFYGGATRYFFLTWFLTMLMVAVWCEQVAGTALAAAGKAHRHERADRKTFRRIWPRRARARNARRRRIVTATFHPQGYQQAWLRPCQPGSLG